MPWFLSLAKTEGYRDVLFASAILVILCFFFIPVNAFIIDIALALSFALSILILLVSLWIKRPLDFSSFPTVLLIATIFRLALNIATTRLILTHGADGTHAAGYVIDGFAKMVMGNDFVIGVVIFLILLTVNFIVITKGATRIAEVGARFTLDAIPGKQMAIDADLSAGVIDEQEAQRRRRELEEESSFFGSMDGASKFVRGDAIAGLIILAINIVGGVAIGVMRHKMAFGDALEVFTKLSIGDGLVSQIPALIVSLAAGLLVSKGGTKGATEQAFVGQLGGYPQAMMLAAALLLFLGFVPGLPFLPFALTALLLGVAAAYLRSGATTAAAAADPVHTDANTSNVALDRERLWLDVRSPGLELCFGPQLSVALHASHSELAHRVSKIRRRFAKQFGFVIPEIKLRDDLSISPQSYLINVQGVAVAGSSVRLGEVLVILKEGVNPEFPGDIVKEPSFGQRAMWIPDALVADLRGEGYRPIDPLSVILTHLTETIRSNLSALISYKDVRNLLDGLDSEYKRLIDEICPATISYSGLLSVLRYLLDERVSIRNVPLILEAIAEISGHFRRPEQIVEHVRTRLARQICQDISGGGALHIVRVGTEWDLAFHQSLKRDQKGDVVDFEFDPRQIEQFGRELSAFVEPHLNAGLNFAIVTSSENRPYVRAVVDRLFPAIPVLSHAELARGVEVSSLGSIS